MLLSAFLPSMASFSPGYKDPSMAMCFCAGSSIAVPMMKQDQIRLPVQWCKQNWRIAVLFSFVQHEKVGKIPQSKRPRAGCPEAWRCWNELNRWMPPEEWRETVHAPIFRFLII